MNSKSEQNSTIIVTGGAGFIGSNFILDWINCAFGKVINIDLLTYAASANNLDSIKENPFYSFVKGDINDSSLITKLLNKYTPKAIVNFAAESHVDHSIVNPGAFINTNINGVYNLLKTTYDYWSKLNDAQRREFRFLHISTDEVYGFLDIGEPAFTETSQYKPSNPYSASKAASDHLVKAWWKTYDLPVIVTNCSNNYGPCQFPEKLIPLTILNALNKKNIPIYGDGRNIRDWLFVSDHCEALRKVLSYGIIGETYNIGGAMELTNLEVVKAICSTIDEIMPLEANFRNPESGNIITSYNDLIIFVPDRLGHDKRYAINFNKIKKELNWQPKENFDSGIKKTIDWYVNNKY